jgi:hypothetical protein
MRYSFPFACNERDIKRKRQGIVTIQCSECGHGVPAGKDRCMYCGAPQEGIVKVDGDTEADVNREDSPGASMADVPWQFTLEKTKRRKPLGLVAQIIIFFAGFALMGFIVLLLS